MSVQVWALILPIAQLPPCFMPVQGQPLVDWLESTRCMIPRCKRSYK
jgi:hypothetical protein